MSKDTGSSDAEMQALYGELNKQVKSGELEKVIKTANKSEDSFLLLSLLSKIMACNLSTASIKLVRISLIRLGSCLGLENWLFCM